MKKCAILRLTPTFSVLALILGASSVSCSQNPEAETSSASLAIPGQLITVNSGGDGLPDAGQSMDVTYASTSFKGGPTTIFGQIALPSTPPPDGGYPVVSWGYGTTGFAPQCAPSLTNNAQYDQYLNEWVKRGYAVLRTDYEDWGANGPRLVLNGRSNANAIADIVTSAHAATNTLGDDWISIGKSEGGGAALWTAGLFDSIGDGRCPLKGAIAIAPTGPGVQKFMDDIVYGREIDEPTLPFVA